MWLGPCRLGLSVLALIHRSQAQSTLAFALQPHPYNDTVFQTTGVYRSGASVRSRVWVSADQLWNCVGLGLFWATPNGSHHIRRRRPSAVDYDWMRNDDAYETSVDLRVMLVRFSFAPRSDTNRKRPRLGLMCTAYIWTAYLPISRCASRPWSGIIITASLAACSGKK